MARDGAEGFRKVSHKTRRGRKRNPVPHTGHHAKKIPTEYDRTRAKERRNTILDLRTAELEDEMRY